MSDMKKWLQLMESAGVCPQCGSADCTCEPGECDCKPVSEGTDFRKGDRVKHAETGERGTVLHKGNRDEVVVKFGSLNKSVPASQLRLVNELEEVTSPEIKAAYAALMKTKPRTPERKAAIQKYQKLRLQAIDDKKTRKEEAELDEGAFKGVGKFIAKRKFAKKSKQAAKDAEKSISKAHKYNFADVKNREPHEKDFMDKMKKSDRYDRAAKRLNREEVELDEAKGTGVKKFVKGMRVAKLHNPDMKGTVIKGGDNMKKGVEVEWDSGKTTVASGKYLMSIKKESVELDEAKFKVGDEVMRTDKDNASSGKIAKVLPGDKYLIKYTATKTVGDEKVSAKDLYLLSGKKKKANEEVELDEAKEHPAYKDLMKLAKELDGTDTRAIQVMAGKISNFTATGNRGNIVDLAKYFKALDSYPRDAFISVMQKHDKALLKSIAAKAGFGIKEEVELDEGEQHGNDKLDSWASENDMEILKTQPYPLDKSSTWFLATDSTGKQVQGLLLNTGKVSMFKDEPNPKNWEGIEEAHGNSKIYDKCWDGYKKVPGKKRGEKGSCVKEDETMNDFNSIPQELQQVFRGMMSINWNKPEHAKYDAGPYRNIYTIKGSAGIKNTMLNLADMDGVTVTGNNSFSVGGIDVSVREAGQWGTEFVWENPVEEDTMNEMEKLRKLAGLPESADTETCSACSGKGHKPAAGGMDRDCEKCDGTGKVTKEKVDESYPMAPYGEQDETMVNFSQTKRQGDASVTISAQAKSMEELHSVLKLAGIDPHVADNHAHPEVDVEIEPVADPGCGCDSTDDISYSTDKQALADMIRQKMQQKLS